jgi:DNA-binding transcriptional MerR regulator
MSGAGCATAMVDDRPTIVRADGKAAEAFRTISEAAAELALPQHVLRFWETRFPQVKPLKRGGGRRYYRPEDMTLLRRIQGLLYDEGYTIRGVQKLLKENGVKAVLAGSSGAGNGSAVANGRAEPDGLAPPDGTQHDGATAGPTAANGQPNGHHDPQPDPASAASGAPALQDVSREKLRAVLTELEDIRRLLKH